jgi:tetratricopeptide (TPR) repeat protein
VIESLAASTAWLQHEYPNVLAAMSTGVANGNAYATTLLANGLRAYAMIGAGLNDWMLVADAASAAADAIDFGPARVAVDLLLATMYGTRNDYDRAERHLTTALAIGRASGWDGAVLTALANLAVVQGIAGRLREARAAALECIEWARPLNMSSRVHNCAGNLGYIAYQMGELDEALEWFAECEDMARRGDVVIYAEARTAKGSIEYRRGRLAEAEAAFRDAIAIADQRQQTAPAALAMARLASVLRERGELDTAADLIRQALATLTDRGVDRIEAEALNEAALLSVAQGEPERGAARARRAYELARRVGVRWTEVVALNGLSVAYRALGRLDDARAYGGEALAIAGELGYADLARDAATLLASLPLASLPLAVG